MPGPAERSPTGMALGESRTPHSPPLAGSKPSPQYFTDRINLAAVVRSDMSDRDEAPAFGEELISACRTVVGDELRSLTYFTADDVRQLYLRSDLERTADLVGFAEVERTGFRADELYRGTQLGEYRATVRMFEDGYLTRVIDGESGVWVTTDAMSMERFEELATAAKSVLRERAPAEA